MILSFVIEAMLGAATLYALGVTERGIDDGLQLTARFSFLLFLPAYVGSPLSTLFGPVFKPLKDRGREFGLAFASAHLAHLGLVAALCIIGAAPPATSFVVFGIAVGWTYLIALFSTGGLQRRLTPRAWWLLRTVGMNYIMFAFAADFLREPLIGDLKQMVAYLPFQLLAIAAPLVRLAAFAARMGGQIRPKHAG